MNSLINRKKFIVYPEDYDYRVDEYKSAFSWYQAKKIAKKMRGNCAVSVCRLYGRRNESLSFWNVAEEWIISGD